MASKQPCKESGCGAAKLAPYHRCYWHHVATLPIDEQIEWAIERRPKGVAKWGEMKIMSSDRWAPGRRWCSGCNFQVPLWYTQGSRCKACTSHAGHSAHLQTTYGITYAFYLALLKYQDYKCYICRRRPLKRRLAVDHDHETNEVRGLLCSGDRSCNHDILGNIKSVEMAQRIVDYLMTPPARAVRAGQVEAPLDLRSAGASRKGKQTTVIPQILDDGMLGIMQRQSAEAIERRARAADPMQYSDGDWLRWPKTVRESGEELTILNADPDIREKRVWEKRCELFREKQADRAAR